MDKLTQRRKEVRALRAGLAKNVTDLRERLNPLDVVENLMVMIDPKLRFMARLQSGIRRNPLLAAGLIAGASWLISNGSGPERGSNRRRQHVKTSKTVTNNRKGEDDDTQQHQHDNPDQRPDFGGEKQSGPQF